MVVRASCVTFSYGSGNLAGSCLGSGKSAGPGAPFQTSRWCSRAAVGWELSFGKRSLSSGWGECSVLWLRSVYRLEG